MTDIASAIAAEIMGREEIRGNLSEGQTDRLHGAIQEIVERHLRPPAAAAITSPMAPPDPWPAWDEIEAGALGDTCPWIKIARRHNMIYADVLKIADRRLHGRVPASEDTARISFPADADISAYVRRFKRLAGGG